MYGRAEDAVARDADAMRVRSPQPELDDVFAAEIPFPGSTVLHPGQTATRSFAPSRACRISGIVLATGLVVTRLVIRRGPRFREDVGPDGARVPSGEDCLVFDGVEQVRARAAEWKAVRLSPESQSGFYLEIRNDSGDDLRDEGVIHFASDPVPEPEHYEL